MAYVIPTPATLKLKYPAFADVADATIQLYIDGAQVDTTWLEADYANAIMAYAAWAMTDASIGTGGEIAGYIGQGVNRLKSGTLDVSFSDAATSATGFATNVYGREYDRLLRKNKGGPRVVRGCTGPVYDGYRAGIMPWAC